MENEEIKEDNLKLYFEKSLAFYYSEILHDYEKYDILILVKFLEKYENKINMYLLNRNMMLSQVTNFLKKNKKIMYYLGFFAVMYFALGDSVFAEGQSDAAQKAITVFEGILKAVGSILAILTYLVTLFLDPSWINGSFFGLTEKFRTIWIMVSNVVYFIFAILLVWIAFMNIIGKEGDKYQLKQALPKFVVGVLIVPFSWFIVQMVLSISAVLTVSAITLPYDTFSDFKSSVDEVKIKNECTINLAALSTSKDKKADGETTSTPPEERVLYCKDGTTTLGKLMEGGGTANSSIFAIISTYTFGIISIESLTQLTNGNLFDKVTTVVDVLLKIVVDFLFVLIYAILMIALGLVLMIRGIYLWLYIMFSPLFGLMYFFDKNGSGEGFFEKFNFKEFFALAMVPVYSMLALSFGLLFMYVVGQGLYSGEESIKLTKGENGSSSLIMGKEGENSTFKLNVIGSVGGASEEIADSVSSLWAGTKSVGAGGMGVVGTLIIQFFGIVVLWGTIMAALRSSSITKAVVEPIHQFGTQVGSIMAKAPQNVPIFGGQSMKSMGTVAQRVGGAIDQKSLDRANDFTQKHMPFLDPTSMDKLAKISSLKTTVGAVNTTSPTDEMKSHFQTFLKTLGDTQSISSIQQSHGLLRDIAKKSGMSKKEIDEFKFNSREDVAKTILSIEDHFDGVQRGVLSGGKEWNKGKGANAVDKAMSDITGNTTSNSSSSDSNGSGKIEALDTGKYRLDGKIIVEFNNEENGFVNGTEDGFANYVHNRIKSGALKTVEDIDSLLSDMQVHNKSSQKKIKDDMLKYFDKDGNFVGAGIPKEGDRIENIDELFKTEEKPADDASES